MVFFASTHYRCPINNSEDILSSFDKITTRYYQAVKKATYLIQINSKLKTDKLVEEDYQKALDYLCDDLNTSNVVTLLDKELKEINQLVSQKEKDFNKLATLVNTFNKLSYLLGLKYEISPLSKEDIKTYNDYLKAYEIKDYSTSDKLRSKLIEKGIL